MEDPAFPDSHYTTTTTTTTAATTTTTVQAPPLSIDMAYLKSVPGILRIVEIIVNFIYWIMLAACVWYNGFPLIVAISSWVVTIVFFILFLLQLHKRVTIINWPVTELLHDLVWTVLHFIAACIVANHTAKWGSYYRHHGCSAFAAVLGFAMMILYGVSTFFGFRIFQAGGGLSRFTGGSHPGAGGGTITTTSVTTSQYPAEKGPEAPPPY